MEEQILRDNQLVDHLFRHHSRQMVATLTRILGPQNLELAENAVSESMIKALKTWSFKGIPENPKAWLLVVAKNYAYDELRRKALEKEKLESVQENLEKYYELEESDPYLKPLLLDDRIKLMFLCCHPNLKSEEQVALALKVSLGLGVKEISKGFMIPTKTLEQRLVRAKKKLRSSNANFRLEDQENIQARLDNVYSTLYLLFNEGYSSSSKESLIIKDVCLDAIQLLSIIMSYSEYDTPKGRALLALFYFQSSRLETRLDDMGSIILLENQDRSKWNRKYIQRGVQLLAKSARGEEISTYHLEASIAATHSLANSFEETNWKKIIEEYEFLYQLNRNPSYLLNQYVAQLFNGQNKLALLNLQTLENVKHFKESHFFYSALGEAYKKSGDSKKAKENFQIAFDLANTQTEKDLIQFKIDSMSESLS